MNYNYSLGQLNELSQNELCQLMKEHGYEDYEEFSEKELIEQLNSIVSG